MAQFKKGVSGNPAGKPVGSRGKATTMLLSLMEQNAESITKTVIEAAQNGDLTAARMILDRLVPNVKERPISVNLPDTSSAEGIDKASRAVLEAVAMGNLLPAEGQVLASIIDGRRKALEMLELEQRIAALEARNVTA
jgi:hypothetical protein